MKHLIVLFIAAALYSTASAQSSSSVESDSDFKFGIGGTIGLPMGDIKNGTNLVLSGDVQGKYEINEKVSAVLNVAYLKFVAKSGYSSGYIIPIMAGSKVKFGGDFYLNPMVGVSIISNGGGSAFTYGLCLGYNVTETFDVSVKYQSFSKGGDVSFAGLRLGISL